MRPTQGDAFPPSRSVIAPSHRRRAKPAARAQVPEAEAAVGAGPPLRALRAQADRDDPRRLLRRRRLRTHLPADHTNRIGNARKNYSPSGAPFSFPRQQIARPPISKKSFPRSPRLSRDLPRHPRKSHTSPILFSPHPAHSAP